MKNCGWMDGVCEKCGRTRKITTHQHLCYPCQRIKKIGNEAPYGFDDVPNHPDSKYFANLDYDGVADTDL